MALNNARSILVAGAGDVGMRLACLRGQVGDEVIAVRRRELPNQPGIRMLRADMATGEGWSQLPRRPDAVVFCAAPDERSEAAYRRLYVDGLRRLLDTIETTRVIFVSSTAVYSEDAGEWVDEDTAACATAFNGQALLAAEAELSAHPEAIALRLSGIYGPGREYLLRRARLGAADARRWSNRIHVEDAALALSHLLDLQAPERLYLGSDDMPALECDLMAWMREREGLACVAVPSAPETGRRVRNARLRNSGWAPIYPDFQRGYLPLMARPGV